MRATIKTDDGELIFTEYSGVIVPTKELNDRFAKGEVIKSDEEYFIVAPKFTTASKKYEWINQIQAVGKMISVQNTKINTTSSPFIDSMRALEGAPAFFLSQHHIQDVHEFHFATIASAAAGSCLMR